jgi:hypothetical protein
MGVPTAIASGDTPHRPRGEAASHGGDHATIELGLGAIPQAVTNALGSAASKVSAPIRGRSATGSPI